MGSFFAGDSRFSVPVNGENRTIRGTSQHIYILNSEYFNLDLSQEDLDNLQQNVRNTLVHNSPLPAGYILQPGEGEDLPFWVGLTESDQRVYFINIIRLFETVSQAVQRFVSDLASGKVPVQTSTALANVSRRDVSIPLYQLPNGQVVGKIRLIKR